MEKRNEENKGSIRKVYRNKGAKLYPAYNLFTVDKSKGKKMYQIGSPKIRGAGRNVVK